MGVFGSRALAAMIKAIRKEKQRLATELSVHGRDTIVSHFRVACDDFYYYNVLQLHGITSDE